MHADFFFFLVQPLEIARPTEIVTARKKSRAFLNQGERD